MPHIVIYTTKICPFCIRAKQLLDRKKQHYTEFDVSKDDEKREEMIEKSGGKRTVPQIFINGKSVGGFDDLNRLNQQGSLDALLAE